MSILSKYNEAFLNKDEAAMNEILHDDYKFTMHASGNVLSKQDVIKWAMGGITKKGEDVGNTEICIPTPAYEHHTEVLKYLGDIF